MRIAFPSDDNQFLMPTQQRSYTRATSSSPIILLGVTPPETSILTLWKCSKTSSARASIYRR